MKNSVLYYSVGPLLYCPANNESVADSLIAEKFGSGFSLALCLEDTIGDDFVEDAEKKLIHTLCKLTSAPGRNSFFMPKIFIRVRNAGQIPKLIKLAGDAGNLITGFIAPKFSPENADSYIQAITAVNRGTALYLMPILENPSMIHLQKRYDILYNLKEKLDSIANLILNVRVGGNDLCNVFGFRRSSMESIHNIRPVANILSDIMTVFGCDYVVSGAVWEYYNGENWENGLIHELKEDRLNGFVGKTVIHPKQIEAVKQAYMVSRKDYLDACSILGWNADARSLVAAGAESERMNEYKTHCQWAQKIMYLSQAYGISD